VGAPDRHFNSMTRRSLLGQLGGAGAVALLSKRAWGQGTIMLPLLGGPDERDLTGAFPEKGQMILQRTRPPLLETPFEVFDQGLFTPNDRFFVRWHWAVIPTEIDIDSFSLSVHGHVDTPVTLSLKQVMSLLRQFARLLPAPGAWRRMGERGDGKRQMDGGSAQGCAGPRRG
jgi:DMSO/TMAO reductase YedYZ molybdopterin-dependent catalytic subunit